MICYSQPDAVTGQILAGPILRRTEAQRLVFWLCSRNPLEFRLELTIPDQDSVLAEPGSDAGQQARHHQIRVGQQCFMQLLDIKLDSALPYDVFIHYDLQWRLDQGAWTSISDWAPGLGYADDTLPRLVIRGRLDKLLHGSCRKPHSRAEDGLTAAWQWLQSRPQDAAQWPAALIMTGDQIYADDVAGPMLTGIHQLSEQLGLYEETIEGANVADSKALRDSDYNYYRRNELLPEIDNNKTLRQRFFEGKRKPVFTTATADNHLITASEMIAMYLLVWSPVAWQMVKPREPALSPELLERYRQEQEKLDPFIRGLSEVRRLLAQLPVLMIFDDHDVTDDWNLTADWEKTAYGHPFSKRIIGNALFAYTLCQGWGNHPDAFEGQTMDLIKQWSQTPDSECQDALEAHLLAFRRWEYSLPTEPKLLVMDTRTRRWRSDSNPRKPSGLLDWEALTELQNELMNHESVVLVSAAPVFGVKLIEVVQKMFTMAGRPLLVDAENWMAHRGTANVILNIFAHTKTPKHYVILSGDVHYSFVYGIRVRTDRGTPHIWQVTSSGIKNAFPARLLDVLDRLNRWLYAPYSPLNWLTQRRRLKIIPYRHSGASKGERLLNLAGVGYVEFDKDGKPTLVEQISHRKTVKFAVDD